MFEMMQNSIFSIWFRPREGMRYLQTTSHFLLIFGLALIYFIQISIFVLSLEKSTIAPLFSSTGLKLTILVFLGLGASTFTVIQAFTMTIWSVARRFKGQGTIQQTRAAIIGVLAWFMLIGFFWLIVYFINRQPDVLLILLIIKIASYLGALTALLCGSIILVKTVSEIHNFGFWLSLLSIFFSIVILYGVALTLFPIIQKIYQ
jgi:hypothetical protein